MRNGKGLIGKPVVTYDSGEKLKNIVDLIFDQENNVILGFLVDEGGWFSTALVLPLENVKAIGSDAVIVDTREAIAPANIFPEIQSILERDNILRGTKIMTVDGRDLGTMSDLYFDDTTGIIEGYEVSGGIFADAYSGRSFVPAPETLKIGEDVAFVPSETADLMEEQTGGIKAALQTASIKAQEMAQSASGKAQEAAQATGAKLQEVAQAANTKLTNAVVDPKEQESFVLGKVAQRSVMMPDGTYLIQEGQIVTETDVLLAQSSNMIGDLYRATGGSVRDKLGERLSGAVANATIDQTLGRRVSKTVFTPEGSVVAVEGQIVTAKVIERAKAQHQEQALMAAVGLTSGDALKTSTTDVGHNVKEGAKGLWEQVKETATNLQEHGTHVIEEKRIKGALGRPVTRVILDLNDEVILNVGELITHQAIEIARQADVLEVLLDSVYTETPKLSLDDLRAPEPGKASLS